MARPASAKKPYFTNRAAFGSRELMARRTSLASPLPSFQAAFPAALPAFGATLAPTFAPILAPFLFLLANSLPPSSRSRFLETKYPEWPVRKQRPWPRNLRYLQPVHHA